ncbi:MAG TPA: RNA polymerase sigma factor [Jiangellales bacterium]|nr:RNA polymerase sigma factor [Jiangellales bacterium]
MVTSHAAGHEEAREERDRFERLYLAHFEAILAYALRRVSREDAADVVAETFLVAWRRRDQTPDGTAARLWLYGIARRVVSNQARGQRRFERLGERLREQAQTGRAQVDGYGLGRETVAEAFARLSPADRELLTLVGGEGLSAAEVARVLGCSATAARVRLHRARVRFARELKQHGIEV